MAKRLTPDEWATLEMDFYKWCIESNDISVQGFYRSLNKPKVSQSAVEKRAKAKEWVQKAQDHLNRIEAPKLREEKKQLENEAKAKDKAVAVVETITGVRVDPQGATEYINETIENIKHGMGNNIESFCMMTQIVKNQLIACHNTQNPKPKEGEEQKTVALDPFQAQAVKSLVGALKDIDSIMRKSVRGNTETMKELFSLEDHATNQMIMYKEQAKVKGKDTGDNALRNAMFERVKKHNEEKKSL